MKMSNITLKFYLLLHPAEAQLLQNPHAAIAIAVSNVMADKRNFRKRRFWGGVTVTL